LRQFLQFALPKSTRRILPKDFRAAARRSWLPHPRSSPAACRYSIALHAPSLCPKTPSCRKPWLPSARGAVRPRNRPRCPIRKIRSRSIAKRKGTSPSDSRATTPASRSATRPNQEPSPSLCSAHHRGASGSASAKSLTSMHPAPTSTASASGRRRPDRPHRQRREARAGSDHPHRRRSRPSAAARGLCHLTCRILTTRRCTKACSHRTFCLEPARHSHRSPRSRRSNPRFCS
jgi:hypothetical protein